MLKILFFIIDLCCVAHFKILFTSGQDVWRANWNLLTSTQIRRLSSASMIMLYGVLNTQMMSMRYVVYYIHILSCNERLFKDNPTSSSKCLGIHRMIEPLLEDKNYQQPFGLLYRYFFQFIKKNTSKL